MEFLRIVDPDKPGDYLVIARGDFDPAVHTLITTPLGTPAPSTVTVGTAGSVPVPMSVVEPSAPAGNAGSSVPSIAAMSVAQALPVIEAAATVGELQALEAQELSRPTPRQGVLKAIAGKLAAHTQG